MLSPIRRWFGAREYRRLVINRASAALHPWSRTQVESLFRGSAKLSEVLREAQQEGRTAEASAVHLLTVLLPPLFQRVPAKRADAIREALNQAANAPVTSVLGLLVTPDADPMVNLVRQLVHRTRLWALQGLVPIHEVDILLHEIAGTLRGLSREERAAERLVGGLLDATLKVAADHLRSSTLDKPTAKP